MKGSSSKLLQIQGTLHQERKPKTNPKPVTKKKTKRIKHPFMVGMIYFNTHMVHVVHCKAFPVLSDGGFLCLEIQFWGPVWILAVSAKLSTSAFWPIIYEIEAIRNPRDRARLYFDQVDCSKDTISFWNMSLIELFVANVKACCTVRSKQ